MDSEKEKQLGIIGCVKCGKKINILAWPTEEQRKRGMCPLCSAINNFIKKRVESVLNEYYGLIRLCKERSKRGVELEWRFKS